MGKDFINCNPAKCLPFQIDPCECTKYYSCSNRMNCSEGTTAQNETCGHYDKQCQNNPWLRCGINIPCK
uniref:Uncharacterized protein n=1 Tax=Octopus bimaculoides TaxID=37653 RepID=A0A0L8FKT2_OCTBM